MRCLGLASDHRRCTADAIGVTGYCGRHQPEFVQNNAPSVAMANDWLSKLRVRTPTGGVPDDVKYDVPRWLWRSKTPQVVEHLLHDKNSLNRWLAAFTLRKRRDATAIEPLWIALQNDVVSHVRQQAAVALGKIGTHMALAPLVEALWHDVSPGVRQACAIALGNLGNPVAAGDLAEVLKHERAVFVRWDCVLALAQVGDRSSEQLLRDLAESDRAEVVRAASRQALEEIRRK